MLFVTTYNSIDIDADVGRTRIVAIPERVELHGKEAFI